VQVILRAMQRFSSKLPGILLAGWITLAAMSGGFSGLVVCIGEDGHVELEVARNGQCSDSARSQQAIERLEHCGPCLDLLWPCWSAVSEGALCRRTLEPEADRPLASAANKLTRDLAAPGFGPSPRISSTHPRPEIRGHVVLRL